MEFFSKVACPPILAGRLLVGMGTELEHEEKPRKGKEQGRRWDPQILMSLQMQPICLPILPRVGSGNQQDWQKLARTGREPSFPSHGSRQLGNWGSGLGLGTGSDGHWFTSRGGHPCQSAQNFSCLIFPCLSLISSFFFVTIKFGPRNWPLAVGRLAETNAGWHRRTIVSVGATYCALVLCVCFHFIPLPTYVPISVLEVTAPRGPDSHDLVVFLAFSDGAAGETCE